MQAEARLAARRQARAEAREIRMRELERQQQQQELNADRVFDLHTTASGIDPLSRTRLGMGSASPAISGLLNSSRVGNSMSSRRSSEDSLEEEGRSLRDIRHELKVANFVVNELKLITEILNVNVFSSFFRMWRNDFARP